MWRKKKTETIFFTYLFCREASGDVTVFFNRSVGSLVLARFLANKIDKCFITDSKLTWCTQKNKRKHLMKKRTVCFMAFFFFSISIIREPKTELKLIQKWRMKVWWNRSRPNIIPFILWQYDFTIARGTNGITVATSNYIQTEFQLTLRPWQIALLMILINWSMWRKLAA